MDNIINILTEKTLVPLGLALAVIAGATFWLTTIYLETKSHGEMLKEVSVKQERYSDDIHHIMMDIAEIKIKLQLMDKKGAGK